MTWADGRALVGAGMSIAGDVALAAAFWATWLQLDLALTRPIDALLVVMLMEFIVIHSSAMLGHVWLGEGSVAKKVKTLVGLGILYLVFAGSFASYAGEWWPVVLMIAMLVNRVLTVVVVPDPDERVRKRLEAGWARTTALYVLLAAGTVFLPVPRLGVSDQVVGRADLGGGGLWVDEPHRVIAFGACYFSAVALLEARAQWRSHRTDADLGEASGRPVEVGADRP